MGLKDLTSRLDLVPGDQPVGNMETLNSKGLAGAFDMGKDSPIHNPDSLVEIYNYQHGNQSGKAGPVPKDTNFQDLNGIDGANGYFHGLNNPQKGQGKQVNGEDLHIHLLENKYTYGGNLSPALSPQGEGGVNGGVNDLNGGLPLTGKYKDNGPSDGFY